MYKYLIATPFGENGIDEKQVVASRIECGSTGQVLFWKQFGEFWYQCDLVAVAPINSIVTIIEQ